MMMIRSSRLLLARSLHVSAPRYAVVTVNVPKMGDSISEGTVVEWTKKVGEYVAKDEVVLVIETDKVSVDVRSDLSGTLVEQLSPAEATVQVGAPLFKIDDAGKAGQAAAVSKPAAASPVAPPAAVTAPPSIAAPVTVAPVKAASSHRVPLIKFRYGKGRSAAPSPVKAASPLASPGKGFSSPYQKADPRKGRPVVSKEEMDALESGYYKM